MSPGTYSSATIPCCFPRVSGDEPDHATNIRDDLEFSPRERG